MDSLKREILENAIASKELKKAEEIIDKYKAKYDGDIDIYPLEVKLLNEKGEKEKAYQIASKAIKKNPYNISLNVMMRDAAKSMGYLVEAMKYNFKTIALQTCFKDEKKLFDEELEQLVVEQGDAIMEKGKPDEIVKYQQEVTYVMKHLSTCYGLNDEVFRGDNLLGREYEDVYGDTKYLATYNAVGPDEILRNVANKEQLDMIKGWAVSKIEGLDTCKTTEFMSNSEYESLVPVLSEERGGNYTFVLENGKEIPCRGLKENHFNYYRVPPKTKLVAEKEVRIGTPIVLKQDANKKKLVLNIFLDGLSQKVLREEGLQNIMPNAAKFFGKGVICENAYAGGEWTLPSLANYMTGLHTANHMMLHNELTYQLPEDVTVLAEYFKEQGYYTAKIDGEWRSTPSYGYGRGVDRIVYQHQGSGMRAKQVINDVMDHIELMKDTNQFVWMCIGDLHDIADGFDMIPNVQGSISVEDCEVEEVGSTSVKQKYSTKKRTKYIALLKYIDNALRVLFDYIEENYSDEEMVVSMFGDHGQGYLVEDNEPFLADGRTKVGMMFRSDYRKGEICKELISACDYKSIMCKLAGIPMKNEKIDGKLPKFFGGETERKYVLSESIHPGDPYAAALFFKEGMFFFQTESKAEYDGRSKLEPYQYVVTKNESDVMDEKECVQECIDIVKEHAAHIFIYENE